MFFIRDCNDQIVGNPNGYQTMRGAQAQVNKRTAPAYRAIWDAYYAREAWYEASCMPIPYRRRGISSIRLLNDA